MITGASSGIGRELALAYAGPGVFLALTGRNQDRLHGAAQEARALGAEAEEGLIDVRDQEGMRSWITAQDARRPFDLVIANAGITTGLSPRALAEDPRAVRALIAVNLLGVFNTVEPLIPAMGERGRGHIAFIGSIAGLRGLPYSPAYCAAKAAVHAYSESLRGRLSARGVNVSLVIPGFVKTPLNDSIEAIKPFEMSARQAAILIRDRLDRGRPIVAFPWPLYLMARLARILPVSLVDQIMARFEVNVPQTRESIF